MIQTNHKTKWVNIVAIMKDLMVNIGCERGWDIGKCKGNPHNCTKVKYQILASRSDKQKNDGVGITGKHY